MLKDSLPAIRVPFVAALALTAASLMAQTTGPDPGCTINDAWTQQESPWTDALGVHNVTYPDVNATYWIRWLNEGPTGAESSSTIHGQFPASRYMSLSI